MPATTLSELKIAAIRDKVASALRKALLDGYFRPGEDLSEAALASGLKVSRGPIREALLILAQEGLVTHTQNRGFAVLQLGQEDLARIQTVRLPLERLALELARPRASSNDLERLRELTGKLGAACRVSDYASMSQYDLEFHSAILEMTGNGWLVLALKRVIGPFFTFIKVFWADSPKLTEELIFAQHKAYIDYLKGDNSKSPEECVRFHLSLYE